MFEIDGVPNEIAREALRLGAAKLPIRTRFVERIAGLRRDVMKTDNRLGDLKAMAADELQDELLKLKKEQFNLRFQRATGQLENTARVRVSAPRHRARQDAGAAEARAAAKG